MSILKERYKKEVKSLLIKKHSYKNVMEVPYLQKIVINMGVAEAAKDKNSLQDCTNELTLLAGQKPILTRAKKAIANFKLRKGMPIGLKVTLRGNRMYDFFYRFVNIVAPRIRDFRGFAVKSDSMGNYTLGLEDQQMFPEINLDKVKRPQGMQISFVTSASTDKECYDLLHALGMPFKEQKNKGE